jgi:hypothetical protein
MEGPFYTTPDKRSSGGRAGLILQHGIEAIMEGLRTANGEKVLRSVDLKRKGVLRER